MDALALIHPTKRISPDDHAAASVAATASGKSLNQWASEVINQAANR
ncbi:MAG: toxin-antitoxin system HicB family antitoxin [Methylococcales bacterium]